MNAEVPIPRVAAPPGATRWAAVAAGTVTVAVAAALAWWWPLVVAVLFVGVWVGLTWVTVVQLLSTKFGIEKSFQAVLAVFWRVPLVMLWVGFVLAHPAPYGLPGLIAGAVLGDRAALVWLLTKAGITAIGGTWLPLWTMSKGSRL